MNADGKLRRAVLLERFVKQLHIWLEAARVAADDRQHQRQTMSRGAHHGLRTSADADPRLERPALGVRMYVLRVQRRARATTPGERLARAVVLENLREELQTFFEQDLVLIEGKAEQR